MSVAEFQRRLQGARYAPNDLKYFPLWIRRYSQSVMEENGRLPVSEESVKAFSRSLLETQTPAWQRLEAVRAVEAYRDLVLGTGEPSLGEIRRALQRLAKRIQRFNARIAGHATWPHASRSDAMDRRSECRRGRNNRSPNARHHALATRRLARRWSASQARLCSPSS